MVQKESKKVAYWIQSFNLFPKKESVMKRWVV